MGFDWFLFLSILAQLFGVMGAFGFFASYTSVIMFLWSFHCCASWGCLEGFDYEFMGNLIWDLGYVWIFMV